MPNALSPRDLVLRHDNMDEIVLASDVRGMIQTYETFAIT